MNPGVCLRLRPPAGPSCLRAGQSNPTKETAMKATTKLLTLLLVCALLSPQAVLARRNASTVEELREQIAKLESIDRDPATAAEVRELNSTFLAERRAHLRAELKKRVGALEAY